MLRKAYKFYRLIFDLNEFSSYTAINTLSAFTDRGALSADKAIGATITSNGQYQSQFANYVNDGNSSTYWESISASVGNLAWLKIEFPTAVEIVRIDILSSVYHNERPRNFNVQVSDDGVEWVDIIAIKNLLINDSVSQASFQLWRGFSGYSKQEDGNPSVMVALLDWDTLQTLATTTPNPSGYYYFARQSYTRSMIVHKGNTGFRPLCDGPIEWGEMD